MKHLKTCGRAALIGLVVAAFVADGASATTLETAGTARNASIVGLADLEAGTSMVISRTDGSLASTCTESNVKVTTASPFTGATVGGPVNEMSFTSCTRPVVVHNPGSLRIQWSSGTDGTAFSEGAEITASTPFGTVNCKTGAGTDLGTLTGAKEGNARLDFQAVINCGFLLPSATLRATYTVTGPLGVVA